MATTSSMFLYSLTVQPPSAVTQAILGQFAGTKEQQIVTASGSLLTIHRPDAAAGNVTVLLSQDCFGIIRSLAAFRVAGSSKGKTLFLSKSNPLVMFSEKKQRATRIAPPTVDCAASSVRITDVLLLHSECGFGHS
jgi:splicing factor 3B subunit 3